MRCLIAKNGKSLKMSIFSIFHKEVYSELYTFHKSFVLTPERKTLKNFQTQIEINEFKIKID